MLVIDQGTLLDRIDYNMEQVVDHTREVSTNPNPNPHPTSNPNPNPNPILTTTGHQPAHHCRRAPEECPRTQVRCVSSGV